MQKINFTTAIGPLILALSLCLSGTVVTAQGSSKPIRIATTGPIGPGNLAAANGGGGAQARDLDSAMYDLMVKRCNDAGGGMVSYPEGYRCVDAAGNQIPY